LFVPWADNSPAAYPTPRRPTAEASGLRPACSSPSNTDKEAKWPTDEPPFGIRAYRCHRSGVFGDAERGLGEGVLTGGRDDLIERATSQAGVEHPERGFAAVFSGEPFGGAWVVPDLLRESNAGFAYAWRGQGLEAWLCKALLTFCSPAPARIHVAVGPCDGIDPRWAVPGQGLTNSR
jgi:hypothetical protein